MKKKLKVFVAMSGGVDSSVAAALLQKQGYEVTGVHMKCFNVDGCAAEDAEDACLAAETLRIPFYVFDFEKEYKEKVVEYMIDGYKNGITPNPDVMCNKEIKFGLFYKKAMDMRADYVATGHYVRLIRRKNIFSLAVSRDKNKDQSYFLWILKSEQLKRCLFPIGDFTKPQVRKLAKKFGLHNAEKKDSQGICFLGRVSLPDFLKKYIKPKKGLIVDINGKVLGEHRGAYFYTIGQRSGLGIGGYKKPLYIVSKDVKKNILVVAEGDNHPSLYKKEVELVNINLIRPVQSVRSISVLARVRYRQPLQKAKFVFPRESASVVASARLIFSRPMKFVAPGQSAVFYTARGEMVGGGIIESVV